MSPTSETVPVRHRLVPRIVPPGDAHALRRVVDAGEPRVFQGFALEWPAVTSWTLATLAQRTRGWHPPIARTEGRVLHTDVKHGLEHDHVAFDAFVASFANDDTEGYLSIGTESVPDGLRADLLPPQILRNAPWLRSKLWVGGTGVVSPLHWDIPQNVHVQILGAKRFTLAAPGQWRNVYPFPWWSGIANRSHVDPAGNIAQMWPRFERVECWVAELAPGDAIFIPSRWWHHVRTLRASASVNYWWGEGLVAVAAWLSDRMKHARGTSR